MANTVQLKKDGQIVYPVTDVSLIIGLQDAIKLPPIKTTTLPTASAETAGKMYYVGPDANDEYERYITSAVNGSYEWIDLGGTEIPLPSIADNLTTDDANTALSAKQGKVLNEEIEGLEAKVLPSMLYERDAVQPVKYELGNISISNNGWNYSNSNSRVRTPQGFNLHLLPGDTIGLTDYTDARFYIGCRNLQGTYTYAGWLTADYTVITEGYFCILVCNLADRAQSSADALGSLIKVVRKTTLLSVKETTDETNEVVDILQQESAPVFASFQPKNLLDWEAMTNGYYYGQYGPVASDSYQYSGFIPVISGKKYSFQTTGNNGVREVRSIRFLAVFDAQKNRISSGFTQNVTEFTVPNGVSFVVISISSSYESNSLPSFVEGTSVVPYAQYSDHLVLKPSAHDAEYINSIVDEKMSGIVYIDNGKNLLNPSTLHDSAWVNSNGGLTGVTTSYGYYDYTAVKPETSYHISNKDGNPVSNRSDAYIAFYKEDKTFISSIPSDTTDFTTPTLAAFVRISVVIARVTDMQPQLEEGDSRTSYEEWVAPHEMIRPELLPGGEDEGKILPIPFGSFRNADTLAVSESISIALPKLVKNTRYVATIYGTIESFLVGVGYMNYYGVWFKITPTQVIVYRGSSGTQDRTFTHGLTLGTKTKFILEKDINPDSMTTCTFRLVNDYGDVYSNSFGYFGIGDVFAKNENTSGSLDVSLSFFVADITEKIWLFGDSYLSMDSASRWPYHIISWGHDSFLVSARGGDASAVALDSFQKLLALGARPSFAVWCMGMNGGADSNGAVNPSWLNQTKTFISLCDDNGITPVISTIPSVPSQIHEKMNEWVKSQDYRYIDFAAAVEQSGAYTWVGWGTDNALLSNDEVHPTQRGAMCLAMQVLQDFPEISK